MKRSLLLLPVLAMFLMACPQRHATTTAISPPPASPNPNGYNNAPYPTGNTSQSNTQPGYDGGGTTVAATATVAVNSDSSNTGTVSSGAAATGTATETMNPGNVGTGDSAVHVVGKPDSSAKTTRLVVSFISHGGGIDLAAQKNLNKWISKQGDVKYYTTSWGREGEIDYCFMLADKRSESQAKFVSDVRALIGTNDKVLISENKACTHTHAEVVAVEAATEAPDTPKDTVDPNIARVVVSFISKGEGIDLKAKEKLEKWLSEQNAVYEVKTFGREGEVNFCFFLTGKNSREQDIFIRDLRTFIGSNDMVLVEEWGKCDKRK